MNNYAFQLFSGGELVGEGHGVGHSAMEAFEDAVKHGSVYFSGEVTVFSTSENGLSIEFKAHKQ